MNGVGTYIYKKSQDVYSGNWVNNKKHGEGRYEYGADSSILNGSWENGEIVTGTWELKGAGVFTGNFKMGRPVGEGSFNFTSGLTLNGTYVEQKPTEEEAAEDGPKAPNVSWKGNSIVSF